MDRALEDIITERDDRPVQTFPSANRSAYPRSEPFDFAYSRPPQPMRREGGGRQSDPMTNMRSQPYRAAPVNFESDWVHDRYDEDRYDNPRRAPRDGYDLYDLRGGARGAAVESGAKIRIDNIHYDLTEEDIRDLFEKIGPTVSVRLMYDRTDRSQGTAYVVYEEPRDARRAIADFDGQNANGQPIRLTLLPSGPSAPPRGSGSSMFERIQRPERSMFDRIERERGHGYDSGDELNNYRRRGPGPGAGRRERSDSPRKSRPVPEGVDRYVPSGSRGSRSPMRRRGAGGGGRDGGGRRPGARREDTGRGGRGGNAGGARRGARTDDDGRPVVGGRPRKTADELDAEMADYWGAHAANGNGEGNHENTAESNIVVDPIDDIDMDV
nr:tho complex subunit 4a [Quercus suber]